MSVHPYLFFSGNCREAFDRYQEVLGGDLQVMTVGDMPEDEEAMPGSKPKDVMHAALVFGDGILMGSDDPTSDGSPKVGVSVVYTSSDVDVSRRIFEGLAEGGEIEMPFAPTFYSPGFGGCVDRFGVSWLVDTEAEPA